MANSKIQNSIAGKAAAVQALIAKLSGEQMVENLKSAGETRGVINEAKKWHTYYTENPYLLDNAIEQQNKKLKIDRAVETIEATTAIAPSTPEPTPTPATVVTGKAAKPVGVREPSEKLIKLNLLMCNNGRLFGKAGSCKCCGANASMLAATPAAPALCKKHGVEIPCAKCARAEKSRNARAAKKDEPAAATPAPEAGASDAPAPRRSRKSDTSAAFAVAA